MMPLLAAARDAPFIPPGGIARLAVLFTVLFVLVLVAVVILVLVKRQLLLRELRELPPYTLADLKEMHEKGSISDPEYRRLKRLVSERVRREALGESKPDDEPPSPPREASEPEGRG
jgi:hypothetical protein